MVVSNSSDVFVCLTSDHIVPRSLAFLRSLENVGAVQNNKCFILCFDEQSKVLIDKNVHSQNIITVTLDEIPGGEKIADRPIAQKAFASKPFLMKWAIENQGFDKVIYLDSDTWFINDPGFLFNYLDYNDILLVPYVLESNFSIDNWELITRNVQSTGYYNAGFIGSNRRATKFLDWWSNRCLYGTHTDYYEEIHGDQKYLNWVPSLFSQVYILRNYGINVKHFSTQFGPLSRASDSSALIGEDKIIYFHFSQNLGNLNRWPHEFYPEVSKYLAEVEKARIDCKKDFVDMSARINKEIVRPLLPKYGIDSTLLKILQNAQKFIVDIKSRIATLRVRLIKFTPETIKKNYIKKFLIKWQIVSSGDLRVVSYKNLLANLSNYCDRETVSFFGFSLFSIYLSFLGKKIRLIDPFQGYYNNELDTLFNLQYKRIDNLYKFLGLQSNLEIIRKMYDEISNLNNCNIALIAGRLGVERIGKITKKIIDDSTTKCIGILYSTEWPSEYSDACYDRIRKTINQINFRFVREDGFDLFFIESNKGKSID